MNIVVICMVNAVLASLNFALYAAFGYWWNLGAGVVGLSTAMVIGVLWLTEGWR